MNVIELPGFSEAVEKESLIRSVAFHENVLERIGPFRVRAMTLLDYDALRIARSPLIPPFRETTPEHVAALLWLLSRGKKTGWRRWFFFQAIKRICRTKQAFEELVASCREYVSEALMDRPATIERRGYQPDYFSDLISAAGILAREYGGGITPYLKLPLKIVFQCMKEIQAYHIPESKLALFNPLSGAIINNYLKEANRKN